MGTGIRSRLIPARYSPEWMFLDPDGDPMHWVRHGVGVVGHPVRTAHLREVRFVCDARVFALARAEGFKRRLQCAWAEGTLQSVDEAPPDLATWCEAVFDRHGGTFAADGEPVTAAAAAWATPTGLWIPAPQ